MRGCIKERRGTAVIPVALHLATAEISRGTLEHYTQEIVHTVVQFVVKHSQGIAIYKIM